MERTCENCKYKYEWVDCIQCCDCSCHNRWKPNSELSNFAIEELEKIKRKMIDCFSQEDDIDSDHYNHALDIAISIVHDSITELKGENK